MGESIASVKLPTLNYGGGTLTIAEFTGEGGRRMVELQALIGGWHPVASMHIDRAAFIDLTTQYLEVADD